MKKSLHYLLMADHLSLQKMLLARIKDINLTPGQPKVLDYLTDHDGSVQKDIAASCRIEPATLTSVLLGMEHKGLIMRKNKDGNRRSLYVFLTDKGRKTAELVEKHFEETEKEILGGFTAKETETLCVLLEKLNNNMTKEDDKND